MRSLQFFPKKVLLTAMLPNGGIGLNNRLPWRISEELKLFKTLTEGCMLVVGYNTYHQLPNLPGRCVVLDGVKLPEKFVLCGGSKTYAKHYVSGMEMVVSIIGDVTLAADCFLQQNIQSDIRHAILNKGMKLIYEGRTFKTYATKEVGRFLSEI